MSVMFWESFVVVAALRRRVSGTTAEQCGLSPQHTSLSIRRTRFSEEYYLVVWFRDSIFLANRTTPKTTRAVVAMCKSCCAYHISVSCVKR